MYYYFIVAEDTLYHTSKDFDQLLEGDSIIRHNNVNSDKVSLFNSIYLYLPFKDLQALMPDITLPSKSYDEFAYSHQYFLDAGTNILIIEYGQLINQEFETNDTLIHGIYLVNKEL